MNEEEVKARIVLPYLRELGLDVSELNFETRFSFQIGRARFTVGGREVHKLGTVAGRLDILVTRAGRSLLIVEVKNSEHVLSDDDRDQAVSYARLVHPIAPCTLLTNGREWRLFDVVSKEEIGPEAFRTRDGYDVVLPDEARNEALDLFLGYSIENLLRFCRAQVEEHREPLTGSHKDLTKKYIPELTEPRGELLEALRLFEQGQAGGFLLLADSGCGKTSALCDYVDRRLQEDKPTLFFAGGAMEDSLVEAVKDEFSWTFSEQVSSPALVKRIGRLAKGPPVVVVLDALDEWAYHQRAQNLLNFIRDIRNENVKVVFSCKSSAWDSISSPNGSDIGYARNLFNVDQDQKGGEGFHLSTLSKKEFNHAVRRYREVFELPLSFEDRAFQEARRNPFLLRVMFVVAAETGLEALTFSSMQFFERYFELITRKTGDADLAETQLIGIARILDDRNCAVVSEEDLRTDLGLSPTHRFLPALFEHNILQRIPGGGITFYFQQLRDFLISFRVRHWPDATPDELGAVAPIGVRGEALAFFLRNASDDQIRAVSDPVIPNAEKYLGLYTEVRARHFPELLLEFAPYVAGPVGFLGEYVVPRQRLGFYGFRPRLQEDPQVLLVPVERPASRSNLLDFFGSTGLHFFGSSDGFRSLDITHEVIENEIIEQLREILKEHRLPVKGCPKLVEEEIVAAILSEPHWFPHLVTTDAQRFRFPWRMAEIRHTVRQKDLSCFFEHKLIEKKRTENRIREEWISDEAFYINPLSPEDRALIVRQVDHAIASDLDPKRGVFQNVVRLEKRFRRTGIYETEFEIPGLPWPTELSFLMTFDRSGYSGLTLAVQKYIEQLLNAFFIEYARLVDMCFPTLNMAFELRRQMPVRALVEVNPSVSGRWPRLNGQMILLFEKLSDDEKNEVVVCGPGELVDAHRNPFYKGRPVAMIEGIDTNLDSFLYSPGSSRPLHDMVYGQIVKELPKAMEVLRAETNPIASEHQAKE